MGNDMNTVIELIIDKLDDAFLYIPDGCRWACGIVILILISGMVYKFCLHKNIALIFWAKLILSFFLTVYIYCVLQITIFSRQAGNFGGIDWRFMTIWSENDAQKAFLIANIIMFIPLGILMPMICKWTKHIMISLPIAILSSICIEAVQLKYQLGYCQLDDVVANSSGFLIGFLIYLMIADIYFFICGICNALVRMFVSKLKMERNKDINNT